MKPILVIGDCAIDCFYYSNCERLAPDAPIPVLDIVQKTRSLGMAGNVYRNILALDYPCKFKCNDNYKKITKIRYIDIKTNHMFIRIDSKSTYPRIKDLNKIHWNKYSAIVISDYNKGFLTEEDIKTISALHSLTFLDTKKQIDSWANQIAFIKINKPEYNNSIQFLNKKLKDKIIVTLGSGGCEYRGKNYPVEKVEIKNLSGAGDSFLAGLVVEYLKTNGNIDASLVAANKIATIVVQKRGVSTIKS